MCFVFVRNRERNPKRVTYPTTSAEAFNEHHVGFGLIRYVPDGTQAGFGPVEQRALQSVLDNTDNTWAVQLLYPKDCVRKFDLDLYYTAAAAVAKPATSTAPAARASAAGLGFSERCLATTPIDVSAFGFTHKSFQVKKDRHESITRVLTSVAFWGAVAGEHVLVTQADVSTRVK